MFDLKKVRDVAKPMPHHLLVPIISILAAIHNISGKRASISELCDSLFECFETDKMIIYRERGYGLAKPFDGDQFEEYSGFNERADILCELLNSQYWKGDGYGKIQMSLHDRLDAVDLLIKKRDATLLAQSLWLKFFDENREFQYADLCVDDSIHEDVHSADSEVDPSDLPPELDAANMAFRAVTNGYGDPTVTPRNRLVDYLEKNYPDFKAEQVQRIATVANPDKTTGRKKIGKQ
jgi:hypothetical protein